MKIKLKINKYQLSVILILIIFWLTSAYIHKSFPYFEAKEIFLKGKRFVDVRVYGEENFIAKTISSQLSTKISINKKNSLIATSLLPIKTTYNPLKDIALVGGALTIVEEQLVIMDRLGQLYSYKAGKIDKLAITIPNNLSEFILSYEGNLALNSDTLRAHSITYDKKRGSIIVSYTRFEENNITRFEVASIKINRSTLLPIGPWLTLFQSDPLVDIASSSQSAGGKIIIKNDVLYVAVGYATHRVENGMLYATSLDLNSTFGKIFKINLDNNKSEIFSIGHRNVQGMITFGSNQLISTDQGPQGGDELNLVKAGYNFGWPIQTYGTRYGTYDYSFNFQPSTLELDFIGPFFAFVPSIGISSIIQINDFHERWDTDFLIGSLKAQTIYRLKQVNGSIVYSEPIWIGHRIRDIIQYNKKVMLLTDDAYLIELSVDATALFKNSKNDNLIARNPVFSECIKCHGFTQTTPTSLAPSLGNIYNRLIGSENYAGYSSALKNSNKLWTADNLSLFLQDPNAFMPGTTMPSLGLNAEKIELIIKGLIEE